MRKPVGSSIFLIFPIFLCSLFSCKEWEMPTRWDEVQFNKTIGRFIGPQFDSVAIRDITQTRVFIQTQIPDDQGWEISQRGFVWGLSELPTLDLPTRATLGAGTGSFSLRLEGLQPGTRYHARPFAENVYGIFYGPAISWQTIGSGIPSFGAMQVNQVRPISVDVTSEVLAENGLPSWERGFVYAQTELPEVGRSLQFRMNPGLGVFSATLPDLFPRTSYFVRPYVINSQGTYYGTQSQFTTPSADAPVYLPELVDIPGGIFILGDTRDEGQSQEKPTKQVAISRFAMGKYEITYREFKEFVEATGYVTETEQLGSSIVYRKGSQSFAFQSGVNWRHDYIGELVTELNFTTPVLHVTWEDAMAYCRWLSRITNRIFRLPTEAEWEYAAGGGTGMKTRFGNGQNQALPTEMNFNPTLVTSISTAGLFRERPVPVGSGTRPNALGLYDMSGNVWEWCLDWYDPLYYQRSFPSADPKGPDQSVDGRRSRRGGFWRDEAFFCRVTFRDGFPADIRSSTIGFRVVRE